MTDKIYYYNSGTKTLHIKGFCKSANGHDCKRYYTEQEATEDNGKYINMCIEWEEKIMYQKAKKLNK